MELVSVIVPVYKVEDYLDRCVKSIQNQTYKELEILLVDDGSPDRCGGMCDAYAREDERIRVIHKENGGLGDARNAGIAQASGTYMLFVDSDDRIREDLVSVTVEAAEKHQADVVIFDYQGEDKDQAPCDLFTFQLPEERPLSAQETPRLIKESCSAVNKLFRKSFWDAQGLAFPKGRYYEDLATIPKLMACAGCVVYLKKALYYYLMRDGSIMHSSNFKKNYEDRTAAADSVLQFFKEKGLDKTYRKELEYLVFENTFFVPSREIVLNDRKNVYLEKFRTYAYGKFPELDENEYVQELSGKERLMWKLVRGKKFRTMVFLSFARRMKEKIL